MATITSLRQTYLNTYLKRQDGATQPWNNTECDRFLGDAIVDMWPELGLWTQGDVTSDGDVDSYAIPGAIEKVDEIHVINNTGLRVDTIRYWKTMPGRKVHVRPRLVTGLTLRFHGFARFNANATDLPPDLEHVVSMRAAGHGWRSLSAHLANSQRQQNLEDGRAVGYNDAYAMAAYYEEAYEREVARSPYRLRSGPRAAYL